MISLINDGEIDLKTITTMGVNVKSNENSIGFFGTGLKYAIAVFLRENIDFCLYIGARKYEFFTEVEAIRGKDFDVCYMSGPYDSINLGFTTELGKNWQIWQAYREIHSNCLDEKGQIINSSAVHGKEGKTTFLVGIDPDQIKDVFLDCADPLYSDESIEIFTGKCDFIYYQGIKAKILDRPSAYTYNIKQKCDLTEDRLLCYDFEVSQVISRAMNSIGEDNKQIIKDVVTSKDDFESTINMRHNCYTAPSKVFSEVVASNHREVNSHVKEYVMNCTPLSQISPMDRKEKFIGEVKDLVDDYGYQLSIVDGVVFITGFSQ